MLAPTPMLRPSPMDLTGLFAGTINALKQRAVLLVLTWLLPTLLTIAVVVLGGLALFTEVGAAILDPARGWASTPGLAVGAIAAAVVIALADAKAAGMTILAAYEIAQGERPTFGGVWTRSRGFLVRMAPVIAVFVAAALLFAGAIAGTIWMAVSALSDHSGARAVGAFGLIFLLLTAQAPVTWWLKVKLLYAVPAAAIEQTSGFASLKRSWTLTRGNFSRTLGYYLVGSLAIGMVAYPVALFGQLPLIVVRYPEDFDDIPRAWAAIASSLPLLLVAASFQILVQLITEPLMQTYTAYMFIDQLRRAELPPTPAHVGYGYPTGPRSSYQPAPGQYWGPPGSAYPPQPGPVPGVPGQGYQPPAQPGGWQPPA